MSQVFYSGLVSVVMSSWANDISMCNVVPRNMHRGS